MISHMLMPVVSNTSPLLNLAIIDQLHLLLQQFEVVVTPAAVKTELQLDTNLPGTSQLRQALRDGWWQVESIKNIHLAHALQTDLDKGEAEAITLALESGYKRILIDESDGRQAAKLLGLQPIGILGILLKAKKMGQISQIYPILVRLRIEAGFFIAPTLQHRILQESGEQ